MAPRLRKMKTFHPRKKRTTATKLRKQALHDLQHRISADVGGIIVLIEEGNITQLPIAKDKAKSNLLKHGPEMQEMAKKMGDRFVHAVRDYLKSVDVIVHSEAAWIDEDKIRTCQVMGEKLEKEISAA